jgi:ubiquitin-protein ligase
MHGPTRIFWTNLTPFSLKGSFICLDMLRPAAGNGAYSGWSSAYSVLSILLQLQSFLFAENIPQVGRGRIVALYHRSSASYQIH